MLIFNMLGNVWLSVRRINQEISGLKVLGLRRQTRSKPDLWWQKGK